MALKGPYGLLPKPLRLGPKPSWGAASGRALPAFVGASGTMPSVGTFRDLKRTLQVKELRVEIVRRIGLNRTSGMFVLELSCTNCPEDA